MSPLFIDERLALCIHLLFSETMAMAMKDNKFLCAPIFYAAIKGLPFSASTLYLVLKDIQTAL
jgi:hypothetical protein